MGPWLGLCLISQHYLMLCQLFQGTEFETYFDQIVLFIEKCTLMHSRGMRLYNKTCSYAVHCDVTHTLQLGIQTNVRRNL